MASGGQRAPPLNSIAEKRGNIQNNSWSIKAEYLYVSLPANPARTVATTFLGPAALPTDVVTLSSSRDNLNIVRVGLNYRFIGL